MRRDLILIVAGVIFLLVGQYIVFYEEPKAWWTFDEMSPLGFHLYHEIPELYYPLREAGLSLFTLGLGLFVIGIIVSIRKH